MRNKRSKKVIALVLMLTMVFSFNAYAKSKTMTAEKNGLKSVWNLELTSSYMGSGMYTFTSTERQVDYRKFDEVNLKLEVFCIGTDIIRNISAERVYQLTETYAAYPVNQAIGSAYSEYFVDDVDYGYAKEEILFN